MRRKTKFTLACLCVALGTLSFALVGCDGNGNELSTGDEPKLEIPQEPSIEEPSDDGLYGEWTYVKYPTCEEAGEKVRHLLAAPYTAQTATVAALGHEWGAWGEETAPTCLTDGVKMRPCSHCNNKDYAPIPALGHEWGEWEVKREATCLSAGYETRVCELDGSHTETRAVEALGHDYSEWVFLTAPTCTQVGSEQRVCRNDNKHSQFRVLAALGHDWNEPVVTKAPNCLYDGTLTKICRHDSLHTETEAIPALGHDWGEWILTKAPTESENGTESRWCANGCLTRGNRSVPFLGSAGLVYTLNAEGTGYIVSKSSSFYSGKELYIPAQYEGLPVTEIEDGTFWASTSLTKVVFGGQIQKIGYHAFASCTRLETLGIPNSVTEIGGLAFEKSGMKSFRIPAGVKKVGVGAFNGWTAEQSIFVAGFASQAEADAAWGSAWRNGCNAVISYETGEESDLEINLTFNLYDNSSAYKVKARNKNMEGAIVIPAYYKGLPVKEICDNAFVSCKKITRITVEGNNLERVGTNAFVFCEALQKVELPDSVRFIARNAFRNCTGLEIFKFPEGVTGIEDYTFYGCTSLLSVTLPSALECVGRYAFQDCTSLLSVILPSSLEGIGYGAFRGCTAMTSIVIPESVVEIGGTAFSGWTEEQFIFVADFASEEEADAAWGENWREGCNAQIVYETGESDEYLLFYLLDDGSAYEVKARLRSELTAVTIPAYYKGLPVKQIAENGFISCLYLTSVTFEGNNLEEIGRNAFMNNPLLEEIVIPEGVTTIGVSAFSLCNNLKRVTLPSSLESIESYAFVNCTAITSIVIPDSVAELGSSAFKGWTEEQTIFIVGFASEEEADEAWGSAWREGCNAEIVYGEQEFLAEGVKSIGAGAFRGCVSFSQIVIPTTVESVGRAAFSGWTEAQTIIVKGYASEEDADAAWGSAWREGCNAVIVYEG